jgi:hypothetical protein
MNVGTRPGTSSARPAAGALALAGFLVIANGPAGADPRGSVLAHAMFQGELTPELVLAQRVIEREWPTRADTSWRPGPEGWKSEGGALALSALVPGAGQLYVGERSGIFFALAEVAGWVGWWLLDRRAEDLREDAVAVAGTPADSASAWSFERWSDATADDPSALMALYQADPEAFYDAIADDDRYAAGWSDTGARERFGDLRARSDERFADARRVQGLVWINHLVAAADALRAARIHNIPLGSGIDVRARARLSRGRPGFLLALERKF